QSSDTFLAYVRHLRTGRAPERLRRTPGGEAALSAEILLRLGDPKEALSIAQFNHERTEGHAFITAQFALLQQGEASFQIRVDELETIPSHLAGRVLQEPGLRRVIEG